jgi:hypothetical protein
MVEGIPNRPADGAVQALAVDPTNANVVYAAAVNGGIWKTTDATDANPVWTPLTDQGLPAESMQSIAISPVHHNTIFAGTGSTSSFNIDGNDGFGIVRSTDGGKHWKVLATSTFLNQRVRSIVPTTLDHGNVILAATFWGVTPPAYNFFPGGGVYRSTDNGETFQQVSGTSGSGLPAEGVSDLVADPSNPSRFYAAVAPFFFNATGAEGVYRSDDGGKTWLNVSAGLTGLDTSGRILLSVHNSPGNDVLYAAVIDSNGDLQGVFRSADLGVNWTALGVPSPQILHQQGLTWHGAIALDPTNPNVVFISGDRQDLPTIPNVNGCVAISGNVFRADASLAAPWQNVVGYGAQGSSPADDARALVFDGNGDLLQANDGGIYRLVTPDNPSTRVWISLNSNLGTTEYHSVAYDSLSHVIMGAAQDDGIHVQSAPGSKTYTDIGTVRTGWPAGCDRGSGPERDRLGYHHRPGESRAAQIQARALTNCVRSGWVSVLDRGRARAALGFGHRRGPGGTARGGRPGPWPRLFGRWPAAGDGRRRFERLRSSSVGSAGLPPAGHIAVRHVRHRQCRVLTG